MTSYALTLAKVNVESVLVAANLILHTSVRQPMMLTIQRSVSLQ